MSDGSRPTVTGPVTGGVHGWPFGSPVVDLAEAGYREDEFFLQGQATRFAPAPGTELTGDGRWRVEPVGTAPYKTRLVVIRPEDPATFSGTVVVSWNNVSAGYDNFGGGDNPVLLEAGCAFVAVSAQRAGIHGAGDHPMGLLVWDPDRYGSLSITSDDYSFDIFTQAAEALSGARADGSVDPMGGLEVRRIIAQGASQSAARLSAYVNAVQPLARAIDGFMLTLYFGSASPLEVGEATLTLPVPGSGEAPPPRLGLPTRLRDDLDVPVFVVNSECEADANYGVRQPDTDRFRYWEAAGTCHISRQAMASVGTPLSAGLRIHRPRPGGHQRATDEPRGRRGDAPHGGLGRGGCPPAGPAPDRFRRRSPGDQPRRTRHRHRRHPAARGRGPGRPQQRHTADPGLLEPARRLVQALLVREATRPSTETGAQYVTRFEEATRAAEKEGVVLPARRRGAYRRCPRQPAGRALTRT